MDIINIYNWIVSNWGMLVQVWLSIIGLASIIVKLTPTIKDDTFLKKVIKFTGKYLAINRK